MPELCRFMGIVITMYPRDHDPPHFHARYAEHQAQMLLDGTTHHGVLPAKKEKLVSEWAELHGDELEACWNSSIRGEPPGTIEPLP